MLNVTMLNRFIDIIPLLMIILAILLFVGMIIFIYIKLLVGLIIFIPTLLILMISFSIIFINNQYRL
jgi:hypothetical protein